MFVKLENLEGLYFNLPFWQLNDECYSLSLNCENDFPYVFHVLQTIVFRMCNGEEEMQHFCQFSAR